MSFDLQRATAAAERVIARCRALAAITDVDGETTRTFLSPAMRRCHTSVTEWMQAAGMTTHPDNAGNLYGTLGTQAKKLVIASHLDTVPNAGAFDGILGVILGIELAASLDTEELPFAIEVIGFSEEEGVRFGFPFIGSLAYVGALTAEHLERRDAHNISVHSAIAGYGLDPDRIQSATHDAIAYLEVHIEQGPLLEAEGRSVAPVTSILGQSRFTLAFHGTANHAGTTPMHLRHDAMAAAAEWIVAVESTAKDLPLVATVGSVKTIPGAGNVIAGEVHCTLDVRSEDNSLRTSTAQHLLAAAQAIAATRGVTVTHTQQMDQATTFMDAQLTALLASCAPDSPPIPSGAGHDAMIVAPHIASTMLFARSPNGISHNPAETVDVKDIAQALRVSRDFILKLAAQVRTP